jgi:hypothetical protein
MARLSALALIPLSPPSQAFSSPPSPPSLLHPAYTARITLTLPRPRLTMLDPKWTGTVVDRQDMHNLNLEQVVRASAPAMQCVGVHL